MFHNNENNKEINTGNGFIDIKSALIVKMNETFIVYTENGPKQLTVEVTADLNTIEEKYHEVFLNVLSAKYLNRVSFGDNPFSECKPFEKRKWYEFWKYKLIV